MKKNKSFLLIAAVLAFLFTLTPTKILAQESIIDRLDKSLGVKLPAEYEAKVRDLLKNSNVFKVIGADDCTAQFIENWMGKDWKIDKQNQLVFLWHCIYKKITDDDLYNPEDGDSKRLQDFNDRVVGMRIRAAGQGYENEIVAYMNKVSAEAQQRSAEAQQRIAEADQRIAAADQQIAETNQEADKALKEGLGMIVDNYHKFKTDPSDLMLENLKSFKLDLEKLIRLSKRFNFDYKAFLREKIGDETKYKEFLKIFEIE